MLEVILREDIKTLGKAGDMVRVKPGYARNYLLPRGLAYEATEGNKKRIAAESNARGVRLEAEKKEATTLANSLGTLTVTITQANGATETVSYTIQPPAISNGGKRCDCPGNQ